MPLTPTDKIWMDGTLVDWDDAKLSLEDQLTEIMIEMLVAAETSYRASLVRHRDWIIERKADAEAEIRRRRDEAERKAREREAKLARERIGRLLTQARALDNADRIRSYVDAALARAAELPIAAEAISEWAAWARAQADSIDPVRNGTVAIAIQELSGAPTK